MYIHTCIYFNSSVKKEYVSYICGEFFFHFMKVQMYKKLETF